MSRLCFAGSDSASVRMRPAKKTQLWRLTNASIQSLKRMRGLITLTMTRFDLHRKVLKNVSLIRWLMTREN